LEHLADLIFFRNVGLDDEIATAVVSCDEARLMHKHLGGLSLIRAAAEVDCDVSAFLGEADGDRLSDSCGSASDECIFSFES
jgi:hypothetical protein